MGKNYLHWYKNILFRENWVSQRRMNSHKACWVRSLISKRLNSHHPQAHLFGIRLLEKQYQTDPQILLDITNGYNWRNNKGHDDYKKPLQTKLTHGTAM